MAGYIMDGVIPEDSNMIGFHTGRHLDTAALLHRLGLPRVISLQVDGDEAAAVLLGLNMYQKGAKLVIRHHEDCTCSVANCHLLGGEFSKTVQL